MYTKRAKQLSEISSNNGVIMSLFSVHYYRNRIILQSGPPIVSYVFCSYMFYSFSAFPANTLSESINYAVLYKVVLVLRKVV